MGTTVAGTGLMWALLQTVRWEAVPYGEVVKVVLAIGIGVMGYLMYGKKKEG